MGLVYGWTTSTVLRARNKAAWTILAAHGACAAPVDPPADKTHGADTTSGVMRAVLMLAVLGGVLYLVTR